MNVRSLRAQLASASLLALSLASAPAHAIVTQPNGLVVPLNSMNGETQIFTLFAMRGETGLDWQADGNRTPATFSPLCDFRATLVLRQTASSVGVGWYNVRPGMTTIAMSDIIEIVPAGSPVGTVITGANIRTNPNYMGGQIGFALLRTWGGFDGRPYATQAELNPQCTGCTTPGPWVMSLIYPSRITPNAFYVAFEDGNVGTTNTSFQNDGDYNDYVFFFEGLQCSGGGEPCDTGMMGVCRAGLTQCGGMGCRQSTMPSPEVCDGLDNNCNGMTDEGSGLCMGGNVCDRGRCVPPCVEGACFGTDRCINGLCVEAACVGITCRADERCVGGTCRGACDGVTCPAGRVCRAGACVDPCAGVMCPSGQACNAGVCRTSCACASCPSGQSCNAGSGLCIESSCAMVDCSSMPGTVCRAGTCVDRCAGATCPAGQVCRMGECVTAPSMPDAGPEPAMEAGASDASTTDANGNDSGTMDGGATDGGAMDGAARRDAGSSPTPMGEGCGCRAPAAPSQRGITWALIVAATVLASRKRRASR